MHPGAELRTWAPMDTSSCTTAACPAGQHTPALGQQTQRKKPQRERERERASFFSNRAGRRPSAVSLACPAGSALCSHRAADQVRADNRVLTAFDCDGQASRTGGECRQRAQTMLRDDGNTPRAAVGQQRHGLQRRQSAAQSCRRVRPGSPGRHDSADTPLPASGISMHTYYSGGVHR